MRMLLNWVLSAFAVWLSAQIVPGMHVSGAGAALIAALVIGFINATLGLVLKIVTFPLTVLTLGVFWIVINALMLKLAAVFVRGFQVNGFWAAFVGAIVLSLVNLLLRAIVAPSKEKTLSR
jgi:putative membrane protein